MAYPENESVGALVRGALDDMRELIREEIALARVELRQEVSKVKDAGIRFGAAGVSLMFAMACLVATIALGISWGFGWPAWAGFLIMTILLAVAGTVLYGSGRRVIRDVQPLPHTVQTIKENMR